MRRIAALVIILALLPAVADAKATGDVSCDGETTTYDAMYILKHEAGQPWWFAKPEDNLRPDREYLWYIIVTDNTFGAEESPCWPTGDLNQDGIVNPIDALLVFQIVGGQTSLTKLFQNY
ncbi:hypothetical protein ACFL06_00375 [Patescibacteria group bacterium]